MHNASKADCSALAQVEIVANCMLQGVRNPVLRDRDTRRLGAERVQVLECNDDTCAPPDGSSSVLREALEIGFDSLFHAQAIDALLVSEVAGEPKARAQERDKEGPAWRKPLDRSLVSALLLELVCFRLKMPEFESGLVYLRARQLLLGEQAWCRSSLGAVASRGRRNGHRHGNQRNTQRNAHRCRQ
jgi:hypothetical protein